MDIIMGKAYWYLTEPIKCCENGCNGTLYIDELIYTKKGWSNRIKIKCCNKCNAIYISKFTYEANERIVRKLGITKVKDINLLLDKGIDSQKLSFQTNQNSIPTVIEQNSMKNKKIVEIVKRAIMKDVFTDINTKKCIIDIFLQDQNKFNKLGSNINRVSLNFLNKCKQQLKEEYDKGKILFFRKYNYEKILNEYLSRTYHIDISKINLLSNIQEKEELIEQEKLMLEEYKQDINEEVDISSENKPLHTEVSELPIQISKVEIPKTEEQKEQEKRSIQEHEVISNINKIVWNKTIGVNYCIYDGVFYGNKVVEFRVNNTMKKNNPSAKYIFKYDKKPIHHVEYNGSKILELIESTHPKIKKNKNVIVVINKERMSNGKNSKKTISSEIEQKQKEALAKKNAELEAQRKLKEERRQLHQERIKAEQDAKRLKELENQKRREQLAKQEQESLEKLPQIGIKDFVVRRAVFKCMHSKHEVVDLTAAIRVIGDDGKAKLVKISAGYCKKCKVYFVMESTYEKIRNMGVVLCRICDEKSYMKNSFVNGMKLAQESILMQFGYNVSQTEGLSSTKRQKILAVIIDNHILSKSEIISYLDFFISQRQYQSKFELAVSKWEADREFVEEYRIGEYTQFGVNAIYRR